MDLSFAKPPKLLVSKMFASESGDDAKKPKKKKTSLELVDDILEWVSALECKKVDEAIGDTVDLRIADGLPFYRAKHIEFILKLFDSEAQKTSYTYCQTEHLRMQALYWALSGLYLLQAMHRVTAAMRRQIVAFVMECFDADSGGFSGSQMHDAHLLNTLSALQVLVLLSTDDNDVFHRLVLANATMRRKLVTYICGLQQSDGSFAGDIWGELDTRFAYAAVNALGLLQALDAIDSTALLRHLAKCRNVDGGFGTGVDAESHAGMVFCCVGALRILEQKIQTDLNSDVFWWLCERQVHGGDMDGGLNGRPEKLADVCYSWWVLSALSTDTRVERFSFIDSEALSRFVLSAQDSDDGGLSDRRGDAPDVYHTYFGIAALSMLTQAPSFKKVDPIWALPLDFVKRLGLNSQFLD